LSEPHKKLASAVFALNKHRTVELLPWQHVVVFLELNQLEIETMYNYLLGFNTNVKGVLVSCGQKIAMYAEKKPLFFDNLFCAFSMPSFCGRISCKGKFSNTLAQTNQQNCRD